jgi:hypothetical protein
MTEEINPMGEFYERIGYKITHAKNAWWYEVQPKVLHYFPNHRLIELHEEEIQALMHEYHLRGLRFPTSLNSFGFVSNIAINTNLNYDFDCLHQKARNQTRRGLENCHIKEIDFDYLREKGLSLNQDTAQRQGFRNRYADPTYWRRYCQAAKATPGVNAWGAFVGDQLAAFLISIEVFGWAEWVVNHSAAAYRNKYPNNALAFQTAQHYFQKKECKGICYGLGSLEQTSDLDHFKERMGWTLKPIKQRIVFSKGLQCMFLLAREPILRYFDKMFPKSYKVRKILAMIRHYREQGFDIPSMTNEGKTEEKKDNYQE